MPKFLHGSNFRVLTYAERIEAIEKLAVAVSERLGFPVDLFSGVPARIDVFWHLYLASFANVQIAVAALKQLSLAYRRRESKEFNNSVAWRNTSQKKLTHRLQIYDKTAERIANREFVPLGVLKVESQYLDADFFRGYSVKSLLEADHLENLFFAHLPH